MEIVYPYCGSEKVVEKCIGVTRALAVSSFYQFVRSDRKEKHKSQI
jgi:hypothetical protein